MRLRYSPRLRLGRQVTVAQAARAMRLPFPFARRTPSDGEVALLAERDVDVMIIRKLLAGLTDWTPQERDVVNEVKPLRTYGSPTPVAPWPRRRHDRRTR